MVGTLTVTPPPPATPAAGVTPVTPDPAECRVTPRSVASLMELAASVAPDQGEPVESWPPDVATEADLPDGPPADPATAAAVAAVAREYVACVNLWDRTRLLALATDDYVRRYFALQEPYTPEQFAALATPLPSGPEWSETLLEVRDVRVLPDGRVSAIVVLEIPHPGLVSVTTTFFIFERNGDRWLIDDAIGVARGGTPTP
jgi:hypothetical protein